MARLQIDHIIVIGAGAAGLMAARELVRAGKQVAILEARDRCGGRIDPLPLAEFGYRAEGGAEFIHGEAPVTYGLLREAGLSSQPVEGARWNVKKGVFSRDEVTAPHSEALYEVLEKLTSDMTVTALLDRYFAGPEFAPLRQSVLRMVKGYDAADPERASVLAIRDEWMHEGRSSQARLVEGYGAMIDYLTAECRKHGADFHFNAAVSAIEATEKGALVRGTDGATHACDAAILTVPLPCLQEIVLPPGLRDKAANAANIGFGNVIKLLLRFKSRWWTGLEGRDLSDLLFLLSEQTVPVWWTQHPSDHPVLTGWLAGPGTNDLGRLDEIKLIETGVASLAEIAGFTSDQLRQEMVAARAINWANDPFARGAYSYATLETRQAQSELANWDGGAVLFSGEALYQGRDMGTVEAALASGLETARIILRR
jgi:monoamine oxidase